MNGAVHGLAAITANTPEKNASTPGCFACTESSDDGASWPTSNAPIRLSPIRKNITASTQTTPGF